MSNERADLHRQLREAVHRHLAAQRQGENEITAASEALAIVRRRAEARSADAYAEVRHLAAMLGVIKAVR